MKSILLASLLALTITIPKCPIPPPPIPSPSPTPVATATPSPEPTSTPSPLPTASPTPIPTPSPSAAPTCHLPAMPECGKPEGPPGVYGCCQDRNTLEFNEQVDTAINTLQFERPDLFNGEQVLNDDLYVQGVARILQRDFGLCSTQGGPSDEIGVKDTNDHSEQYDILLGNGRVRRGGYTVTCKPARF